MDDEQISRQNISYYQGIAAEYDAMLSRDESNATVRARVAAAFTGIVKRGTIIDFGGGTGQDLGWLLQHSYSVIFCEPSAFMRQIAMERTKPEFSSVLFVTDDRTDFRTWHSGSFDQKADAVLANFAVINCIPDIALLFEKMAMVLTPGANMIALVLNTNIRSRLRSNLKATIKSLFTGNTATITIDYNGERQRVYLHSTNALKKAAVKHFEFMKAEQLQGSGFRLIHLVRK